MRFYVLSDEKKNLIKIKRVYITNSHFVHTLQSAAFRE